MTTFRARITGSVAGQRPEGGAASLRTASATAVPVGKGPVGQGPIGQGPVGQGPVGQAPVELGPIGLWGFTGVAVAALGGPLALAALYAPSIAAGAAASAGLAMVAAAVVFGFPLAIWFGYARHLSSSGGLYTFTEAAAGRRVALVQAGLWIVSYLLYVVYTTAQIVYDTLPAGSVTLPRVTPARAPARASCPAASNPTTIKVARRPAIITPAITTGMTISSGVWYRTSPGSTAGSVS